MATLMKNTQPHWQGNTFIPVGHVLPQGHPQAIPEFFESFEIEVPATRDALVQEAESLGIKVDKRWGDDRLRQEIEQHKSPLTDDEDSEIEEE